MMNLVNYVWLVAILLSTVGVGVAYVKGRVDGSNLHKAKIEKLEAQAALQTAHYNETSLRLQRTIQELRSSSGGRSKRVAKIVERPLYHDACFDDDGLRIANEALTGDPGGVTGTVPSVNGFDRAEGPDGPRSPNETH